MSGRTPPRYTQRTMIPDTEACIALGRAVVADGRLKSLRERLGLTRNAMSELLYTNTFSYADWEKRPTVNLRRATAERVGRFYHLASLELEILDEFGLNADGLVPFHAVAANLGVPNEVLLEWYRQERFEAVDAGVLGLWVEKTVVAQLRGHR